MSSTETHLHVDEIVTIDRVLARGHGDWAVVLATDEQGRTIKAVGQTLGRLAQPQRRVRVSGFWRRHPEHGREVVVQHAAPALKVAGDAAAVEDILLRVPHVGEKRAQILIDRYGAENVMTKIDASPRHAFLKVASMPFRHAGEASRWWNAHRAAEQRAA